MAKASCWSITINNPTAEDLEAWKNAKSLNWVKDVQGQLEQGENGTQHIQGLLKTEHVRFAQVKKAFPRAHIEAAKNKHALAQYVQKEETRIATIATTKVASPQIVQERLTSAVESRIFHKGFPVLYSEIIDTKGQRQWASEVQYDADQNKFIECVRQNRTWIHAKADELIDEVVSALIEEGYYGIEFAIANNQVRNGYKKYISSIVIRHHAQRINDGSTEEARISQPIQSEERLD